MNLGIRGHDVLKNDLVCDLKEKSLNHLQLVLKKVLKKEELENLDSMIENYALNLKKNNIKVSMLGAYFNPIQNDLKKLENDIKWFKKNIDLCDVFNTTFVGSETGSYNNDKWTYNPLNHTKEAFNEVKKVFTDLAIYAKEKNKAILIEGAYNHVIYNPSLLKKLITEIGLDNVFVIIDIYNYLYLGNYKNAKDLFDESLELFKDQIKIFHIKDFTLENDGLKQVPIGQGLMPYPYMIKRIKEVCPNATLIFEGVTGEDITTSTKYIKKLMGE